MDQYPKDPKTISFIRSSASLVGKHFKLHEFECSDCVCQTQLISLELVERLDKLRDLLGQPIYINSGYRCQRKQDLLKAKGYETAPINSPHTLGCAADIRSDNRTGVQIEAFARQAGFTCVGVARWWVHVDIRMGEKRWAYTKRTF